MEEKVLYDSTPSMFRNSPIWFIMYVIVPIASWIALFMWGPQDKQTGFYVIGITISFICWGSLFLWWLEVVNTGLKVSNERISFRKGILSKNVREVFLSDIRSVEIDQTIMQRITGTGRLEISSAASSDAEITISGIPDAYEVKKIIDEHRRNRKK
ncbi:PH domain-containing protein [Thiotrichales bacterium HSG1]|nr:PH domain-containing protein [Thiotrichales bacterium HSG1]